MKPNPNCDDGWCRKCQERFQKGEINQEFVEKNDNNKSQQEIDEEAQRQANLASMADEFGFEIEDEEEEEKVKQKENVGEGLKLAYQAPDEKSTSGEKVQVNKNSSLADLQAKLKAMQSK